MHSQKPPTPKPIPFSYDDLHKIGLNPTAIACYKSLFEQGGTTATELAKRLHLQRTSLYRVLKDLEAKGFVRRVKADSISWFHASRLDVALYELSRYQHKQFRALVWHQLEQRPSR